MFEILYHRFTPHYGRAAGAASGNFAFRAAALRAVADAVQDHEKEGGGEMLVLRDGAERHAHLGTGCV